MHHYQTGASPLLSPHPQPGGSAAAAAAAAAARLSPQSAYHAFAYNGVGAAVAAAAAAAAFGQPAPSPHTHPHLAHPHQHPHPAALTTHHSPAHLATPKLTDSSTDQMSATSSHRTASTSPSSSSASASSSAATSGASSSAMFHTSSLRNEQSSGKHSISAPIMASSLMIQFSFLWECLKKIYYRSIYYVVNLMHVKHNLITFLIYFFLRLTTESVKALRHTHAPAAPVSGPTIRVKNIFALVALKTTFNTRNII